MSLTSIFFWTKVIKEFRDNILKSINLSRSGKIYVFTEIEFLLFDKKRVDGLILMVEEIKSLISTIRNEK